LVARGASVIVFDVYFARERSPDDDRVFAEAIADAERVLLYELLEARISQAKDQQGVVVEQFWGEQPVPPFRLLAEAARGLGSFPLPKEKIAVTEFWAFKESTKGLPMMPAVALQLHALDLYGRFVALLEQAGAAGLEALPRRPEDYVDPRNLDGEPLTPADKLKGLMGQLRGIFKSDPGLKPRLLEALERQPESAIPAADRRRIRALASLYDGPDYRYLNLYGYPGQIPTIDYHLLLDDGENGAEGNAIDLTGKVVFIGSSDIYFAEQPDRFFTAFTNEHGVDLSGVEIMASAFANLLTERSIRPSDTASAIAILLTFGLALGTAVYLLPAFVSVPLAFVLTAAYGLLVQVAFNSADLWLPAAVPTYIQFPFALLTGLVAQYLLERRQRQQVSEAISYYLPENVVKDLTERGLDPDMLNQVVHGVCLATDMSGFTTISEKMAPKELAVFMNDYFDSLALPLKSNEVDVTEFHADSIMCAWTSMQPDAGLRRNAIFAALDVVEAIGEFAARHGQLRLNARIGLDEGRFYLGHTGGGGRLAYSILGDCANTASRMEGLNKHIGTHVLATQSVVEGLDGLLLRPLGWFRFVGKSDPSPVVEILAREADASKAQRMLCARFAEALELFRSERWGRAAVLFRALLKDFADDGPARFYLERCRDYHTRGAPEEQPTVIRMEAK
ncbi:MAG: adenylate/guanylate cyclase domain-containing protein, partial [Rhodospirillales bacterium]|nr:adenylate/guanylate cyclase domain-containing protein [Rhodospirillales bacterium]